LTIAFCTGCNSTFEIRSSSVAADHNEFKNIKEVEITSSNDLTCTILFDNNHSIEERILKEQFFS